MWLWVVGDPLVLQKICEQAVRFLLPLLCLFAKLSGLISENPPTCHVQIAPGVYDRITGCLVSGSDDIALLPEFQKLAVDLLNLL